nr:MAG TPA: hypothetical protein [Caudoviricetes sp.]
MVSTFIQCPFSKELYPFRKEKYYLYEVVS